MNRKKMIIMIIVAAATLALVGYLILGRRSTKIQTVKTAVAARGDIKAYLSTNAVIQSKNTKSYMGTPQLTVKTINVKVGDRVKPGETILTYDVKDLNTSLQQARIQYSNALLQRTELINQKKQLDDAIKTMNKQIALLENSQNPSDIARLQSLKQRRDSMQPISDEKIKLMENSVSLAKLALDTANSKYEEYRKGIVSDIDGVVTMISAAQGWVLNPAQPAVVIQQLDNLKAVVNLGKYDAQKIRVGQEAVLRNGDITYKGVVSFVDPAAVKATSLSGHTTSLQADIDILSPNPDLKVDFDVNVDILLDSASNVLKIPVESIKYDKDNSPSVFAVVNGAAKQVAIKLGIQSDTEAQVTEGLSQGDMVVLNPGISISSGTPVKISEGG